MKTQWKKAFAGCMGGGEDMKIGVHKWSLLFYFYSLAHVWKFPLNLFYSYSKKKFFFTKAWLLTVRQHWPTIKTCVLYKNISQNLWWAQTNVKMIIY